MQGEKGIACRSDAQLEACSLAAARHAEGCRELRSGTEAWEALHRGAFKVLGDRWQLVPLSDLAGIQMLAAFPALQVAADAWAPQRWSLAWFAFVGVKTPSHTFTSPKRHHVFLTRALHTLLHVASGGRLFESRLELLNSGTKL